MKKGTKVSWTLKAGMAGGSGTVISDEVDGQVLVSVERQWEVHQQTGQKSVTENEMHYVLNCTVTWLTPAATSGLRGRT